MQVGPEHWKCVTTDSAGVPHGGQYGNVEWFEEQANRVGLKVAWSPTVASFGIYTVNPGGKHVWQLLLRNHGNKGWADIIPMNHTLLVCLTFLREEDCREGGNLMANMALKEKHRKQDVMDEWDRHSIDMEDEVWRRADLRAGRVTPNIMVMPGAGRIYSPRSERRRLKRHRRKQAGRIILA